MSVHNQQNSSFFSATKGILQLIVTEHSRKSVIHDTCMFEFSIYIGSIQSYMLPRQLDVPLTIYVVSQYKGVMQTALSHSTHSCLLQTHRHGKTCAVEEQPMNTHIGYTPPLTRQP